MREAIGSVVLNLDYYSGNDQYSDGQIEDDILNIVQKHQDIYKVLSDDTRWPVLYHLSPQRENLLEWFPFEPQSNVLEIGAGCGALTGLLCNKVNKVTAVELSKKRSLINAYRNKDKSNLEIIVGNLNDINFNERFDYITLVGVLEYAGKFTDSNRPYLDFLNEITSKLVDDGTLIIAIENKFGLKYWAGANEDHTNNIFEGIENYIQDKGILTFSKDELKQLLSDVGFQQIKFYYPMPDYKMPTQIYSDHYLPDLGAFPQYSPNYDSDRLRLFNERLVYDNLILNKKFDFFANSFLVICKK